MYPNARAGFSGGQGEGILVPDTLSKTSELDRTYGLAQQPQWWMEQTTLPARSRAPDSRAVVDGYSEGSAGLHSIISDIPAAAVRNTHRQLLFSTRS